MQRQRALKLDRIHSVPHAACTLDNSEWFDVAFMKSYHMNSIGIPKYWTPPKFKLGQLYVCDLSLSTRVNPLVIDIWEYFFHFLAGSIPTQLTVSISFSLPCLKKLLMGKSTNGDIGWKFLSSLFQKALFLFLKSSTRCEQFQCENSSSVILKVAFLRKMLMI